MHDVVVGKKQQHRELTDSNDGEIRSYLNRSFIDCRSENHNRTSHDNTVVLVVVVGVVYVKAFA